MIQNLVAERAKVENNSLYVSFNQYLQSFIEEMKKKPILDQKGEDLNQVCEELLT